MPTDVTHAHPSQARLKPGRKRLDAMRKRALKASLVALVVVGGGYLWQQEASERIAQRAEQARLAKMQMTPRKLEALEREAQIAAKAKAFAEHYEAEQQAQARRNAEEKARLEVQRHIPQSKG